LDTRTKILDPAGALAAARRLRAEGKPLKVIIGHFDPVLAGHARRVSAFADGSAAVMAILTDPPRPVLAARARAELVAALAAVNYVVLREDTPLDGLLAGLAPAEVLNAEDDDRKLTRNLIQHVQSRQSAT
jgi:bifunctional ADP-heptose synthase (sugar kinase/adenylyltransferase)